MTTTAANEVIPVKRNWKSWLFNPFKFIAGSKALAFGLAFIIVTSLLGRLGHVHFDGVLDAHYGSPWPAWAFIAEGLIDWLSLALVLSIFAATMWRKTSRFIDVVGTQALARWPAIFTAILLQGQAFNRVLSYFMAQAQQGSTNATLNPADLTIVVVTSILVIAIIVWMVALMYRAFAVSCNAQGAKAVIVFIIAIIIGEAISKVLIISLARFIS